MNYGREVINFDKSQLSANFVSARFYNLPLIVNPSVISLLVQEHGLTSINQTTIFCALYFNNENDVKSALVLAMKKIINKQIFSIIEKCAALMKLSIIKSHLLWLDEHPTAKIIDLNYINDKNQTQKILIHQQREIYGRLKNSIMKYSEDDKLNKNLEEIAKEIYNIPKRIINFIFQINMRLIIQNSVEMLLQVSTFFRHLRGIHWYNEDKISITDEDYVLMVKRLILVQITKEPHQTIYNHIGEEIFGKMNSSQVVENIKRIYKVPSGIMTLIVAMNKHIKSTEEMMHLATFCGYFYEKQINYEDKDILTSSSSATGAEIKSHCKPIIGRILWKLCWINSPNIQQQNMYKSLVQRIIGVVKISNDDQEIIMAKLKEVYFKKQKIIFSIINLLKNKQPLPDFTKLLIFCSYVCYQFDTDRDLITSEIDVIKQLQKLMLPIELSMSGTIKDEEEEIRKLIKEKYKVPEGIIHLVFNVHKGKDLFQKIVLCSYFKDVPFVHNRVSTAVENLYDESVKELTTNEKTILYQISKFIEQKKTNVKHEEIYKSITKHVDKKKVEESSPCPVM